MILGRIFGRFFVYPIRVKNGLTLQFQLQFRKRGSSPVRCISIPNVADGVTYELLPGIELKPHKGNAWKDAIGNRLWEQTLFRNMVKDVMTTTFKFVGYITLIVIFYGADSLIPDFDTS